MRLKLLFDQNISFRVIEKIKELFPASSHVAREGLEKASDEAIWLFAKEHGYTIVTKDSDFNDMAVLRGAPPYIVWIRSGNSRVEDIARLLIKYADEITHSFSRGSEKIIEIY